MARQYSFFDLRDEHSEPVLVDPTLARARVTADPQSVRDITDGLVREGAQWSGQQRLKVTCEVERVLCEVYFIAIEQVGDAMAAAILLRICAHDQAFDPPRWLRSLWAVYRDEMREIFHRDDVGRETDYSEEDA